MPEYDVFISHASEDKDVARPIARSLSEYGVDVWFDEDVLTIGDSLTRSIDKGLSRSSYGLVILSPSFFEKDWTEYELKGLTTKEIQGEKVILPIWHRVDVEEVASYSPTLADKVAISTGQKTPNEIALEIIEEIRPDLAEKIHRRLAFIEAMEEAETERVDPQEEELKLSPPKHDELPSQLISRIRLIRAALLNVYRNSMEFWVDGFRGDAHPSQEILWWEHLAACYLEFTDEVQLDTEDQHEAVYQALFTLAMGGPKEEVSEELGLLPDSSFEKLKKLVESDRPPFDFDEEFPSGTHMTEEEKEEWLEKIDKEYYDSLDRDLAE